VPDYGKIRSMDDREVNDMHRTIEELMTTGVRTVPANATVHEAAKVMRDSNIGDVVVTDDGRLCGILTDRDVVVRAIAEGRDPTLTRVGDIASGELTTVSPDDTVDRAVQLMRERAIRRLPVQRDGQIVGVVALGDLAIERDYTSALADISAAPPNR
jgi:CBS domain-containing protein